MKESCFEKRIEKKGHDEKEKEGSQEERGEDEDEVAGNGLKLGKWMTIHLASQK
jgi:hypothetical protein